jgi:FMN phosphatase YigB (HAD superfamily)
VCCPCSRKAVRWERRHGGGCAVRRAVLTELSRLPPGRAGRACRGVGLAVVSNNWPGLDDLYRRLGLHSLFTTIVVSAEVGANKPDPRLWRQAADALGLAPSTCLVVDDDPDLVDAAIDQGYQGVAVQRTGPRRTDTPAVRDLRELTDLLDRL